MSDYLDTTWLDYLLAKHEVSMLKRSEFKAAVLARQQTAIYQAVAEAYADLIKNVTKPETVGGNFLHAEVEEFAKQLEQYLEDKITALTTPKVQLSNKEEQDV